MNEHSSYYAPEHVPACSWPPLWIASASIIDTGHDTAARMLKMLINEEKIELVTLAGDKGSRRAAEYRYLEDKS